MFRKAIEDGVREGVETTLASGLSPIKAEIDRLRLENAILRGAINKMDAEISQTLGKVLGCPWFKDDPTNFPDATEADGVCVGDEVAESLAVGAARQITTLRALLAECADDLEAEINARYGSPVHPALQAKYDLDMEPVRKARDVLGGKG